MATIPSSADFLVQFPEFEGAPTALVSAKLADAAGRTDEEVWGGLWSQGVMYRAADLLAKSPHGRKMMLVSNNGKSIYHEDLQAMIRRVTSGFRVVGEPPLTLWDEE